jgi:hypothetical protein
MMKRFGPYLLTAIGVSIFWLLLGTMLRFWCLPRSVPDPYSVARHHAVVRASIDLASFPNALPNGGTYTTSLLTNAAALTVLEQIIRRMKIEQGSIRSAEPTVSGFVRFFGQPPMIMEVHADGYCDFVERWDGYSTGCIAHGQSKEMLTWLAEREIGANQRLHLIPTRVDADWER